ncbi:hypothetical protein Tco_0793190 [Tanacetum coccineum]
MKAVNPKTQATASRPIKALMVYPPNTSATLVPRVLPTKKHFEGIQKAPSKDIKEMKDIFEELEAEVDQNGVDRKHDEIERKNLLIAWNEYSRKGQKESQKQTKPSTGWKSQNQSECMRTRSQARRLRQQQEVPPNLVEPPKDTMANNRTMAELLQAPTEGYEDAIVVPEIEAANFEIKHGLLTLVQNKQFFGHDKEDPHAHIRYFNKITSTLRYPNVPTTSIKLMLFPFSLEGAARIWLEKEPWYVLKYTYLLPLKTS